MPLSPLKDALMETSKHKGTSQSSESTMRHSSPHTPYLAELLLELLHIYIKKFLFVCFLNACSWPLVGWISKSKPLHASNKIKS